MKTTFTLFLFVCTSVLNAQTTINLAPQRDNTIYSSFPNNSNGAGEYFFVGRNAGSNLNSIQRALLYFDVSSIPSGATVTSATLNLYVDKSGPVGTGIEVHKATAAWGEGTSNAAGREASGDAATSNDATWNMRMHPGTAWNTSGGDFSASVSATETSIDGFINESTPISLTVSLAADVQSWVDNPAVNFGWLIRSTNESASASVKRFISKESAATTNRPMLSVTYTLGTVPVTLTSFKAVLQQETAVLTWTTATEVNNNYFEIQYSTDGSAFKEIGSIKGAGNSNTEKRYSFTHSRLIPGKNYYRLAQHDVDGKTKYSGVAEVNKGSYGRLVISPNPVANALHIVGKTRITSGQYSITNTSGGLIKKGLITEAPIEVSALQSGMYILTVQTSGNPPETVVFYKK